MMKLTTSTATPGDLSRRSLLAGLASISVAHAADKDGEGPLSRKSPTTLVAYFSRSGNTRVVAGLIQRALAAEWFEIRPAIPYPDDYLEQVKVATEQRDRGFEPPLRANVPNIARYDTLYLGFPIWGETAPAVIRSFLAAHDLSGKTVIPFITHGGYGLGSSHAVLKSRAPRAALERGFSMQAEQERQTMNTVNAWLTKTREVPR